MHCNFLHHWEPQRNRAIFLAGNEAMEAKVESTANVERQKRKTFKSADEAWNDLKATYGPEAYRQTIQEQAAKFLDAEKHPEADAMVNDSVTNYERFFFDIETEFRDNTEALRKNHRQAERRIQKETRQSLRTLKQGLEASSKLREENNINQFTDKPAIKRHFRRTVRRLGDIYLNSGLVKKSERADYENAASELEADLQKWVMKKVDKLHAEKSNPAAYKGLEAEVKNRYDLYSNIDGNSRYISPREISILNNLHMSSNFWNSDEKEVGAILEEFSIANPRAFEKASKDIAIVVIVETQSDHLEAEFTTLVSTKIEKVDNYKEAKKVYKKHVEELSKQGARETQAFVSSFTKELFAEQLKFEKNIEPKSLQKQVSRQLDYLLSGKLIPGNQTDQAIVNFMNANQKGRQQILSNEASRQKLFRGIKIAKTHYPEIFDKRYGNLPDDPKKLRRRRKIANPTSSDQAAQLKALMVLGDQAELIVKRYGKDDEESKAKLEAEMNNVKIPESYKSVTTGLKFKSSLKKPSQYTSSLVRGGFNARDLSLKTAKVLGTLTVLANAVNAYGQAEGDDMLDRIFNAAEATVTNPSAIAGLGVAVGSHFAERNPDLLKYPFLSQRDKAVVMASYKLDSIGAKTSEKARDQFIGSMGEWQLIQKMSADQIKGLQKKAAEESKETKRRPMISVEMLVEEGILDPEKDGSTLATLSRGPGSNRTRYLFYAKFFSGKIKPDAYSVKEICSGDSYIKDSK